MRRHRAGREPEVSRAAGPATRQRLLRRGRRPEYVTLGWNVVILAISALAASLDNPVLRTEGRVTVVDAYLAGAVLVGLVLNAALGWWWADPGAGYVIVIYGIKEGRVAWREARAR